MIEREKDIQVLNYDQIQNTKERFHRIKRLMKKSRDDSNNYPKIGRVSDYLMGDIDTASVGAYGSSVGSSRTKSCDNIVASDPESSSGDKLVVSEISSSGQSESSSISSTVKTPETPTNEELDDILHRHEKGVEFALHRAKIWSKYAKDVLTYVDKRCQLGLDHARNQIKLIHAIRPILKEESFLPFQSIYCTSLDHDLEIAGALSTTANLLQTSKFLEPLSAQRAEHEKMRKAIKDSWHKQLKKLTEAVTSLKRAKMSYFQKNQDLLKLQESLFKSPTIDQTEKLEKKRDELILKIKDASVTYNSCVVEANEQHASLLSVKKNVLRSVRELMVIADQVMKNVTTCYFQMQQSFLAHQPLQFQTLYESARLLEPGAQYREFIKRLGPPSSIVPSNPFEFEPFTSVGTSDDLQSRISCQTGSDTDSLGSSRSAKSDASPTSSPVIQSRKLMRHNLSSGDELDVDNEHDGTFPRRQIMSKAAVTHTFRKLKTPSRCRECDSYVYFHGSECSECGLGCHKKCLETLAIQCGHKRLPRKLTTFGVDLQQHLQETSAQIPHLVGKCLTEIDTRGIGVKGIYRVSGLKSRVEKLCQAFENGAQLVDLTDQHPNVIANVLKLYLRQLPEPLLTFRLYPEFVRIAMEYSTNGKKDSTGSISLLSELIKRLPPHHLWCLRALMLHLSRVATQSDVNNMPPSNLGIVFGPTLLRTPEGSASLNSLVDTVHQTRAIELLVMFAGEIFQVIDNWLPKNLKLQPPETSETGNSSPNTQHVPGLPIVTSTSGSSSSSSSTSSTSSSGSAQVIRQSSSMKISSRQNSVSSSKSSSNIPTHNLSVRKSPSRSKTGELEQEDSDWDWNSDEPFGTLPQPSPIVASTVTTTPAVAALSPIVKTSLKNYVGLEMGALEESTKDTLDVPVHQKLRKSLSDNPPSFALTDLPKPVTGDQKSTRKPTEIIAPAPLANIEKVDPIMVPTIQAPQRRLHKHSSSSVRAVSQNTGNKSMPNSGSQELLKFQVQHHKAEISQAKLPEVKDRRSVTEEVKLKQRPAPMPPSKSPSESVIAQYRTKEFTQIPPERKHRNVLVTQQSVGYLDKAKSSPIQSIGHDQIQRFSSKEVLIGSSNLPAKKGEGSTNVSTQLKLRNDAGSDRGSARMTVDVAVSSRPAKLSRDGSLPAETAIRKETVKQKSQRMISVRSVDTLDSRVPAATSYESVQSLPKKSLEKTSQHEALEQTPKEPSERETNS